MPPRERIQVIALGVPEKVDLYRGRIPEEVGNAFIHFGPSAPERPADVLLLLNALPYAEWQQYRDVPVIVTMSAGVEHIIGNTGAGTRVFRLEDAGMVPRMVEYVQYAVLHFQRNFDVFRAQQLARVWKPVKAPPAGKIHIGFLGAGVMGGGVAAELRARGYRVSLWGRTHREPTSGQYAGPRGLREMLPSLDFLVCLLPLTRETDSLLDADTLRLLPRGAVVVSSGRGGHMVDRDLIKLLDVGHLRGAVVDVVREKPLPQDHPFWSHPKVVLTPHVAAEVDPDLAAEQARRILRQIAAGENVSSSVDLAAGY